MANTNRIAKTTSATVTPMTNSEAMLPRCLFAFYVCAFPLRNATARWCSESVECVADASVVTPESFSTFHYPGCLLTELAVGLGPSSAPDAAAPFAPKPHGCLI